MSQSPSDQAVEPASTAAPSSRSFLRELPFLVVVAFVLALVIKFTLVQAFFIPSESMEHTLNVGDRVLVNKVVYKIRNPHRGEIVVFNGLDNFDEGIVVAPPSNGLQQAIRKVTSLVGLGGPDEKDYIKRVIAIPGDRVMCCDEAGRVVVTPAGGQPKSLVEPYVFENDQTDLRYFCGGPPPRTGKAACPPGSTGLLIPPGRLWVMGDHRGDSADSRYHITDANQGTVPEDKVVGRAFVTVYPFGRFGLLRVPHTFSTVALPAAPLLVGGLLALPLSVLRRRRLLAR